MPCAAYLRTPPRHPLISLTLRKNSHFWIGNLLVAKIEAWMDTIYQVSGEKGIRYQGRAVCFLTDS
jgi:hypothetical protein